MQATTIDSPLLEAEGIIQRADDAARKLKVLVNGDLSVREAHHIAHQVESALLAAIPGLEVVIHVEPVDEDESYEPEYLERLGEPGNPPGPNHGH